MNRILLTLRVVINVKKFLIFMGIFAAMVAFSSVISADYFLENPLSSRFRVGWGEVQVEFSPDYQNMGLSLRLEEKEYSAVGSIWYVAKDLINNPQEGKTFIGLAGVYQLGEMFYIGGSTSFYPSSLGDSEVNLIFAAGGYTRKYFRFMKGFSTRGMAALYYQPYLKNEFSFTSACVGMFIDSWGSGGRFAADVKLDLRFVSGAEGKLYDFITAYLVFEKDQLLFGGGWNTREGKINGTVGLTFDAIKTWLEIYYTDDATTWTVNGLITF